MMRFRKNGIAKLIPLGLVLAGLLVACPPAPAKPTLLLKPQAGAATGVSVAVNSTIQFVATDETGKVVAVTWDRSPSEGTIDANGNYKAPVTVPANPVVTIKATSIANPSDFGTLNITIIAQGTAGISGKVTVNPSLLSANIPETTRTGEARAINSGVVDWNAPHVKGSILLIGSNSSTRAAGLRGVQVRNVSENISSLSVPSGETEQAFAARVAQQTGLIAQPEYIYRPMALPTPNDPNFFDEQNYLVQIDAQAGWAVQKDLTDNLIAVLDTGIKTDHEDLIGRFTPGKDFCATFNGATCATEDNDPSELPALDDMGQPVANAGHGTSTAGIIAAATNNAKGVSGLTWTGKILVVKVFGYDNQGAASPTTTLAKAIRYAADQGSKVINLSLGIRLAVGSTDAGIDDAITYAVGKGVVVISAAGNSNEAGFGIYYPARNANVIAVGSVNKTNGISSFSAQGPQLALVAPGEQITSTDFKTVTSYAKLSGTSEATPQVAAIAGLMLTKNPALTRVQVKDILTSTARNLGAASTFGSGLLQAGLALRKASNPTAPPAAKTTVYVYADFFDGTKYDPTNPKSGRVVVDLDNSVGNTTYTLTAKRGGFSSLEAGTYRLVACVNKNSNALACDSGDLGGQKDSVVYNGSTPVTGADITLAPI